jgi:integrase
VARIYLGGERYETEVIAPADDYSDADGVAILSFSQAQAAVRERMVRAAYAERGLHYGPYTVADAVREHLAWMAEHRKTEHDARTRAEAHILPALGEIDADKLTAKDVSKWQTAMAKALPRVRTAKDAKPQHRAVDFDDPESVRKRRSTTNRTFTILRAALNRALADGKIKNRDWQRAKPFRETDAARIRFLTVEEAQRLINCAEPLAFKRLVQAALATGMRYGELARLEVHDFDARSGTLRVGRSKGGKSRHVYLTAEGVEFFTGLCAGRAGAELTLTRENGEPWRASNQEQRMRDAVERAKISPPISFHGLRHSFASLSVMAGMPLFVVSKVRVVLLGHCGAGVA